MTLRSLVAAVALFATPVALAASGPSEPSNADVSTAATAARPAQAQRKIERPRPGAPLKPRMIEAPGAAVMMIPASFDPTQNGPFSAF